MCENCETKKKANPLPESVAKAFADEINAIAEKYEAAHGDSWKHNIALAFIADVPPDSRGDKTADVGNVWMFHGGNNMSVSMAAQIVQQLTVDLAEDAPVKLFGQLEIMKYVLAKIGADAACRLGGDTHQL